MNYLAHLHLAGARPEAQLGGLYGDFVKGPLRGEWPASVEDGIRLHRRIDTFTDQHPRVIAARARFPAQSRRVAGILLDLFFDHRLAAQWQLYADEPLQSFTQRVYRLLLAQPQLPGRLADVAPRMAQDDWLGSYQQFATLERAVLGISRRLSQPQPLIEGAVCLQTLYAELSDDFDAFYPELCRFARQG